AREAEATRVHRWSACRSAGGLRWRFRVPTGPPCAQAPILEESGASRLARIGIRSREVRHGLRKRGTRLARPRAFRAGGASEGIAHPSSRSKPAPRRDFAPKVVDAKQLRVFTQEASGASLAIVDAAWVTRRGMDLAQKRCTTV